jgi:hypothetical protein
MRLFLTVCWLLLTVAGVCSAKNIYIAQSSAGRGDGADCANSFAYTFFNDAANWGSGPAQIGPGATVHMCGVITTFNGSTYDYLAFRGSGVNGQPITLKWEPDAKLSVPTCGSGSCILFSGKSYLVFDGGSNGVVEETDNGSALGHQDRHTALYGRPCNHCEFKNLALRNIYVHSLASDDIGADALTVSGPGISMHHMNCTHASGCFTISVSGADDTVEMYNLESDHTNHCLTIAANGAGYALLSARIHDNSCRDFANWDTTSNAFHHDGIHIYALSGATFRDMQVYNNLFSGDPGVNVTSFIYVTGDISSSFFYNNVLLTAPDKYFNNGAFCAGGSGIAIYNNLILGGTSASGLCLAASGTGIAVRNNIVGKCSGLISLAAGTTFVDRGLDHNIYGPGQNWKNGSTFYYTFEQWKTASGEGPHSAHPADLKVDSSGRPQPNSPAINAGANLSYHAIPALNADKIGDPRSACSAWDVGPYNHFPGPIAATDSWPLAEFAHFWPQN